MSNIVYNEPFECEEWIWKIHDDAYLLKKYRQIDCECSDEDEEMFEYYYDFIMISCFDEKGTHLFTARKYWDEDEIHLLSRPNGSLNGNDIEMMQKLKKKFHVANIRY